MIDVEMTLQLYNKDNSNASLIKVRETDKGFYFSFWVADKCKCACCSHNEENRWSQECYIDKEYFSKPWKVCVR